MERRKDNQELGSRGVKIILKTQWLSLCANEGRYLGLRDNYAGCEVMIMGDKPNQTAATPHASTLSLQTRMTAGWRTPPAPRLPPHFSPPPPPPPRAAPPAPPPEHPRRHASPPPSRRSPSQERSARSSLMNYRRDHNSPPQRRDNRSPVRSDRPFRREISPLRDGESRPIRNRDRSSSPRRDPSDRWREPRFNDWTNDDPRSERSAWEGEKRGLGRLPDSDLYRPRREIPPWAEDEDANRRLRGDSGDRHRGRSPSRGQLYPSRRREDSPPPYSSIRHLESIRPSPIGHHRPIPPPTRALPANISPPPPQPVSIVKPSPQVPAAFQRLMGVTSKPDTGSDVPKPIKESPKSAQTVPPPPPLSRSPSTSVPSRSIHPASLPPSSSQPKSAIPDSSSSTTIAAGPRSTPIKKLMRHTAAAASANKPARTPSSLIPAPTFSNLSSAKRQGSESQPSPIDKEESNTTKSRVVEKGIKKEIASVTILGAPISLRKVSGETSKTAQPKDTSEPITGKAMALKVLGKGTMRDPDSASPDQRETKRAAIVPTLPKLDTKALPPSTSSLSASAKRRKVDSELERSRSNSERKETVSRHNSEKREAVPVPTQGESERRNVLPPVSTSQSNRYPSPATTPALASRPTSAIPTTTPLAPPSASASVDSVFTYPSGLPMLFNIVPDKQGLSFAMEVLIPRLGGQLVDIPSAHLIILPFQPGQTYLSHLSDLIDRSAVNACQGKTLISHTYVQACTKRSEMLNISSFRIELVPDPIIEVHDTVKLEIEDDVPEVSRKGQQTMMTPDSIGERQSVYEEVGDRGTSSTGKKRSGGMEVEVEIPQIREESDYEDQLEESDLDELEESNDDGSEFDQPLSSRNVGFTSRIETSKEKKIPAKDREAYEWLKKKLENWNFKGGRTTFTDKLRKPGDTRAWSYFYIKYRDVYEDAIPALQAKSRPSARGAKG